MTIYSSVFFFFFFPQERLHKYYANISQNMVQLTYIDFSECSETSGFKKKKKFYLIINTCRGRSMYFMSACVPFFLCLHGKYLFIYGRVFKKVLQILYYTVHSVKCSIQDTLSISMFKLLRLAGIGQPVYQ